MVDTKHIRKSKLELVEEIEALRLNVSRLAKQEDQQHDKEKALLQKNMVLQNILESARDLSIIGTDIQGTIVFWNKGARKILGYTAEEMIGQQEVSVLYPQDSETLKTIHEVHRYIFDSKKGSTCEVEEITKSGQRLLMNLALSPRFDESGNVIGILGIGTNISERKLMETALAERVELSDFHTNIGSIAAENDSIQKILDLSAESIQEFYSGILTRFWIFYSREKILEVHASAKSPGLSNLPPAKVALGEKGLGKIVELKNPFFSHAPCKQPQLQNYWAWMTQNKVQQYSVVPLVIGNRILGALELFSREPLAEARTQGLVFATSEISVGIDRVRAFEALQYSEERLRAIVANALEGVFTFYKNGVIASFNPVAEVIFGYAESEIIGKNIKSIIPDLCRERDLIHGDVMRGQQNMVGRLSQITGQHKSADTFPMDLAISEIQIPERRKPPRSDSDTQASLYIAMVRDITERKQLEEISRNEKDYVTRIIERTPALVIGLSLDGVTRIVNPAAEKTTGFSAEEIIGKNWWRTLFPGGSYGQVDYLLKLIEAGPVRNHEMILTTRSGEKRVVTWSIINRYDEHDQLTDIIGFGTDITDQKKVERDLIRAAQKAEESNRLKSDFLGIISHELRTPLTVMLGNTPLLKNPEDLPEPKEIVAISKDIEKSGKHLLALIDDLLDFSKIEAGKMDLNCEPFAIHELVQDVISDCQVIADPKNLSIESQVETFELSADKMRVKQILFNLLSNAIKFTDAGFIRVGVLKKDDRAEFTVEDSGCGLSEDDQLVIFDLFRQVDASNTRAASGTGLGLAITKKLVELHGGKISVTSQTGKGSLFTFYIPFNS